MYIGQLNTTKVKNLYYVKTNSYTKFQVQIMKDRERKVWKTSFLKRSVAQVKSRSTVTKVLLDQYHVRTKFKSISQRTTEKSSVFRIMLEKSKDNNGLSSRILKYLIFNIA